MKIVMQDGRVLQGTALQIVQAMKAVAFGVEKLTIGQYIDWIVDNTFRFEAIELKVALGDDDVRSASLVDEMLRARLARKD
jgi:hypothetical protein